MAVLSFILYIRIKGEDGGGYKKSTGDSREVGERTVGKSLRLAKKRDRHVLLFHRWV